MGLSLLGPEPLHMLLVLLLNLSLLSFFFLGLSLSSNHDVCEEFSFYLFRLLCCVL